MRIDDHFRQRRTGLGRAQPTQDIDKTNPFDRHVLSARGFEHDQSDEIVSESVHRQFFENPFDRMTAQHFHFHGCLEMAEVGLDAPTAAIEFSDGAGGITNRIDERGDDGNGLRSAIRFFDRDAKLAHDERFGKGVVVVLSHPNRLGLWLDVLDELIVLAETFEPA